MSLLDSQLCNGVLQNGIEPGTMVVGRFGRILSGVFARRLRGKTAGV
jgi:hypothetical protein